MPRLFANNAVATLASAITNVATSLTVATGKGALFPSPSGGDYFDVVLTQAGTETSWETVRCTARSGDVLTITRAIEGTAAAWASGDKVELRFTAATADSFAFKAVPQNSQSVNYTCVLGDSGKHLLHPSADTTARTFTIPANSSVAYEIGTTITFINQDAAGVLVIACNDTMKMAYTGATGNRSLQANGIATAIKLTATEWFISGNGLT